MALPAYLEKHVERNMAIRSCPSDTIRGKLTSMASAMHMYMPTLAFNYDICHSFFERTDEMLRFTENTQWVYIPSQRLIAEMIDLEYKYITSNSVRGAVNSL